MMTAIPYRDIAKNGCPICNQPGFLGICLECLRVERVLREAQRATDTKIAAANRVIDAVWTLSSEAEPQQFTDAIIQLRAILSGGLVDHLQGEKK